MSQKNRKPKQHPDFIKNAESSKDDRKNSERERDRARREKYKERSK